MRIRSIRLAGLFILSTVAAACGSGDSSTTGAGGTSATGANGGSTGAAGAGSGGTTGTAGTTGTGAAGTIGAAGSSGSGTAGTSGAGTAGSTGSGTAGAGGGSTGAAGKGAAGAGGTGGGAAGAAGSAGRGAAGTSGGAGAAGTAGKGAAGTSGGAGAGAAGTAGKGAAGAAGQGAGGSNDPCGASNPAVVPLPTFGTGTFSVTSYGAVGDGKTDDTTMLQAALTAAGAAGGGTVVVPSGTFLSGPIVVSSGTNLQLSAGAVLEMLPMSQYPSGATAFITAAGSSSHDIAITGSGTIEGQGQAWWDAFAADSSVARPQEVSLGHVTRVQVSGIRLQNSPEEHIWVKSDTDVTITGITISTLAVSGKSPPKNTNGVDVTATGMFFCNNNIADGDDNIAMSGTNLYIGYSTFGVGHGCSIGSITENGVSGVTVDHLTMNATTSGIRMKSARDRGGLVQNLTYSNVTMTNVPTPIAITSYYPTLPTDPTTDTSMPITSTTPYWKNITIKNVTATGSTIGGTLWGLPEAPIATVVFDNVKIQAKTGMQIFHATGVSFTNGSTVTAGSGAAVTTYDATVTGITTTAY